MPNSDVFDTTDGANQAAPLWSDFSPADRPAQGCWHRSASYETELAVRLEGLFRALRKPDHRALIRYLIDRAEDDGRLPSRQGKASPGAVSDALGFKHHKIYGKMRKLWVSISPYFLIDADESLEDDIRLDLTERVRRYIGRLERDDEGMPRRGHAWMLSLHAVADAIGVPHADLERNAHLAILLRAAVSTGRVRWGLPHHRKVTMQDEMPAAESERILAKLRATVASFDVPGGKLPENARRRGSPDFRYIAELAGEAQHPMTHDANYVRYVRSVGRRIGTLPPGLLEQNDSLAALRKRGIELAEREQQEKGNATAGAVVRNLVSNFNKYIRELGLELGDGSSDAFGDDFDANLAKLKSRMTNAGSAGNFERNMRWWRQVRLQTVGAGSLPADFAEALDQLVRIRGIALGTLAAEAGISLATLRNWTNRSTGPSSNSKPVVQRLEAALNLPTGTLLDKLHVTPSKTRAFTAATLPEYRALTHVERSLLPHDAVRWGAAQLSAGLQEIRHLLPGTTDHGKLLQLAGRDDYRFPPFQPTSRLEDELDLFVDYKQAEGTYPLLRAKRGRWNSASTVFIRRQPIERMFRFASAPQGEDVNAGLGINVEQATMAWFAHPPILLSNVSHRAKRFAEMDWKNERRGVFYTSADVQLVEFAKSLTHPATGWLTQHPELADRLLPTSALIPERFSDLFRYLPGRDGPVISEDDCRRARSDWKGFCERAYRCYLQVAEYVSSEQRTSRDPFEPVAGFINSATPMQDLLAHLLVAESKWADPRTAPFGYQIDVRNSVMMRLAPNHGFRPSNQANLTYSPNQTGQIRKIDGIWEIEVDYKQFKNYRNCRLFGPMTARQNYRKQLKDRAGLYDLLDLWFFDVRNSFPSIEDCQFAFPNKDGQRFVVGAYGLMVRDFGMHHLAWNPLKGTGQPGVIRFNPYAVRHIKATDILKNGQSAFRAIEEAAFAIQTSELMIQRHYGFVLPEEINRWVSDTFDQAAELAWARVAHGGGRN